MSAVHSSISWIFIKEQKRKKIDAWKSSSIWKGIPMHKKEDMNGLVLSAAAIWIQRTDFLLKHNAWIVNSIRLALVAPNLSCSAIETLATWTDDRFFDDCISQLG